MAGRVWLEQARQVASFVQGLASAYGPHGGLTLVEDELVRGAAVLQEVRPDAAVDPYVRLAKAVRTHGGHATAAVLLAAGLVARGLDLEVRDGYALAYRQARAVLGSLSRPAPVAHLLDGSRVDAPGILAGLRGVRDLDAIEVRKGGPEWLSGLLLPTRRRPLRPGVLVASRLRRTPPAVVQTSTKVSDEDQRLARRLADAGVGLLVCATGVEWTDALEAKGIVVVPDAPKALLRRVQDVSGALLVATADDISGLGSAVYERHRLGTVMEGRAWTLLEPSVEEAESFLRSYGLVHEDPTGVPGDGVWQREVAAALRRSADLAPGHAPLAMRAAADAFEALADALVHNAGGDVLDPPPPMDVLDSHAAVRLAVDGAFETALQILRIDARLQKSPSDPRRLRGGDRIGSPKGMPGDIPPLM